MTGYTSDLSIDEALLLEEIGFEPLEFVMGSSFFHIGYQLASWGRNQEMDTLTRAMEQARALAMSRLLEQIGAADGVVGVRLLVDHHHHNAEFIAMGTAVRARSNGAAWRVSGRPFTSDLSGQDFWALARAGWRPRGLVMGCCVYHVAHQSLGQWLGRIGNNCEMPNFTQALYDARELAMERMEAEARRLGAAGVVGTRVEEGSHGWHPHVIEFLALGTAIAPTGGAHEHDPVQPVIGARR
jgi:uncharacterized protein YbjQ (UPF0145 family)